MGVNTIMMINQTSVDKSLRRIEDKPAEINKIARIVIDQILWLTALVLLVDMAVKNKKGRMIAWWAVK